MASVIDTFFGQDPRGICTDAQYAWVANFGSQEVKKYSLSTRSIVSTIGVGGGPSAVSVDSNYVWVSNAYDGTVSQIDKATNSVVNTLTTYGGLNSYGVSSDGKNVWVVNYSYETQFGVVRINALTGAIAGITPIASGRGVSSDGKYVWVTSTVGTVIKLDASSGNVIATINVGEMSSTWGVPNEISSDGKYVWVIKSNNNVDKIDASTNEIVATINCGSSSYDFLSTVSSDGKYVWVTSEEGIYQIDASTNAIVATIPMLNSTPQCVFSNGQNVWVSFANNTISVISIPNGQNIFQPVISDICFFAGTPITTNQGPVAIQRLNPEVHTIRNKRIVGVVQTVSMDKYLVCFEKDAIAENVPSQQTIISKNHEIFYKGRMVPAKYFVGKFENVRKIEYNGEVLYNVLMESHDKMMVNHMICETLHPENSVAQLYQALQTMTLEERRQIIKEGNRLVQKRGLSVRVPRK